MDLKRDKVLVDMAVCFCSLCNASLNGWMRHGLKKLMPDILGLSFQLPHGTSKMDFNLAWELCNIKY